MKKAKRCHSCNRELSLDKTSTTSFRTDGYCTAKCKRKDRNRDYREQEQSRPLRPRDGVVLGNDPGARGTVRGTR